MFNTYIPVVKPPLFGASQRAVADLAEKIRGAAEPVQGIVQQPLVEDPVVPDPTQPVKPAAPQTSILVTQWEPLV